MSLWATRYLTFGGRSGTSKAQLLIIPDTRWIDRRLNSKRNPVRNNSCSCLCPQFVELRSDHQPAVPEGIDPPEGPLESRHCGHGILQCDRFIGYAEPFFESFFVLRSATCRASKKGKTMRMERTAHFFSAGKPGSHPSPNHTEPQSNAGGPPQGPPTKATGVGMPGTS